MIHHVCHYHLGDCFWHCLFLRKVAQVLPEETFVFHCNPGYHAQLGPMLWDFWPQLKLAQIADHPADALNVWIGADYGDGAPRWFGHPLRNDIVAFLIEWFRSLAVRMGIDPVFNERTDLLADYSQIMGGGMRSQSAAGWWDFLIVNAEPQSGQFSWDGMAMTRMIDRLSKRHSVLTTSPSGVPGVRSTMEAGLSITDIGGVSLGCRGLIGVPCGPMWPVLNVWNQRKMTERIMLINDIKVDYGDNPTHFGSVTACEEYLEAQGWL